MLDEDNLDVLIRTGLSGPVAIGLAKNLLDEARIPFFTMDQSPAARQESGNVIGWWSVRVPRDKESEAREILQNIEAMK
jgi:Putative prokaryotic signal transducing protein